MSGFVFAATTVEPRLSGPPLSGTSIIRLGSFLVIRSKNGGVPQTRMRVAAVTMETCLLIFCACADNHVALLFINKVGGSRRGLSIRLSGVFTYPACFWNQGVRIIEVLLYSVFVVFSWFVFLFCLLSFVFSLAIKKKKKKKKI